MASGVFTDLAKRAEEIEHASQEKSVEQIKTLTPWVEAGGMHSLEVSLVARWNRILSVSETEDVKVYSPQTVGRHLAVEAKKRFALRDMAEAALRSEVHHKIELHQEAFWAVAFYLVGMGYTPDRIESFSNEEVDVLISSAPFDYEYESGGMEAFVDGLKSNVIPSSLNTAMAKEVERRAVGRPTWDEDEKLELYKELTFERSNYDMVGFMLGLGLTSDEILNLSPTDKEYFEAKYSAAPHSVGNQLMDGFIIGLINY
ncbi:Hypothetical protein POVN_LOCUS136 [uncultured virus]|nr:Hypothetical protein POVN_LOCUS136 [uncultured virus]